MPGKEAQRLTLLPDGNLLVASYTENLVYAYDSSGAQLYSFSTGAGTANRPRYVAFDVAGSGFNVSAVPEPGTFAVLVASLAVLGFAYAVRSGRETDHPIRRIVRNYLLR